jgi:hypothetical protein
VCSKKEKSDKNAEKKQKKDLTGPTLLEISEYATSQAVAKSRDKAVFTAMVREPVYFVDASQSRAAPRKITPASSLKAAGLHHVLLSFMSDVRFSVIW